MFTREEILNSLEYHPVSGSPETGFFKWVRGRRTPMCESRRWAGCVDKSTGYRRIRLNDKLCYEHRVVFFLAHGTWPKLIDHIDRNKLNNNLCNLRETTDGNNRAHSDRYTNETGYRGVYLDKRTKNKISYVARIVVDGKPRHLGRFDDPIEAAKVFDRFAKEKYGEFANLNFPEE